MPHDICTAPIDTLILRRGCHDPESGEYCAVEAAVCRFSKGMKHSYKAIDCNGSPAIAALMIALNDNWNDKRRQQLLPLVDRLPNSRGTPEQEPQRGFLCADFAVRELVPMIFDKLKICVDHSAKLKALAPITDIKSSYAARAAANYAARAAANYAARAAASAAANYAASAASYAASDASYAARAASYAARAASYAASDASYAARAASEKQVDKMTLTLLDRLLKVTGN